MSHSHVSSQLGVYRMQHRRRVMPGDRAMRFVGRASRCHNNSMEHHLCRALFARESMSEEVVFGREFAALYHRVRDMALGRVRRRFLEGKTQRHHGAADTAVLRARRRTSGRLCQLGEAAVASRSYRLSIRADGLTSPSACWFVAPLTSSPIARARREG